MVPTTMLAITFITSFLDFEFHNQHYGYLEHYNYWTSNKKYKTVMHKNIIYIENQIVKHFWKCI